MPFTYLRLANRLFSILIEIWCVLFLLGCAAQGPPEPPRIERPQQIQDLAIAQVGRALEISFTPPRQATDGERLTKPLEIEIFRSITTLGQKPLDNPAATNPWMTLKTDELVRDARGPKVVLMSQFSEEDFRRWQGSVFTLSARGVTRGFRHRPIASEVSKPAEITLLDVSGPVENLEITAHEKALELRWSSRQGSQGGRGSSLAGYRVYRSMTGAPGSFQLLAETASTTYSDRDFEFNRTYSYRIRATFKSDGRVAESEDSLVVAVTPRDIFPPEAPKGLNGIYTRSAVELIWTANSEPDLAGYNVYRREGVGPVKRLNNELVRTPIYRDTEAEPGHQYLYYVTAVDLSHNESLPSSETVVETR